jgi:hypothetical protein
MELSVTLSFDDVLGLLEDNLLERSSIVDTATQVLSLEELVDRLADLQAGALAIMSKRLPSLPEIPLSTGASIAAESELIAKRFDKTPEATKDQVRLIFRMLEMGLRTDAALVGAMTPGPRCSIEVEWRGVPRPLRWRICQPENKWPGISVRVFYNGQDDTPKTRVFKWAGSLLEHTKEYLGHAEVPGE